MKQGLKLTPEELLVQIKVLGSFLCTVWLDKIMTTAVILEYQYLVCLKLVPGMGRQKYLILFRIYVKMSTQGLPVTNNIFNGNNFPDVHKKYFILCIPKKIGSTKSKEQFL